MRGTVTPFYHEILRRPDVNRDLVHQNWRAFLDALPRKVLRKSDPNFGTAAVRHAVEGLATSAEPAKPAFVLGAFTKTFEGASFSIDPELDDRMRKWFADKSRSALKNS